MRRERRREKIKGKKIDKRDKAWRVGNGLARETRVKSGHAHAHARAEPEPNGDAARARAHKWYF